jgi:transposase
MLRFDDRDAVLEGPEGTLPVPPDDEIVRKLAMLFEGECEGLGATGAARKFGFSRQRYHQLLLDFKIHGTTALRSRKRGPKRDYRRTDEAIRQVIRHRFLDPDASAEVMAQKLRQCGFRISTRSVQRILADFGLQKKTPRRPAGSPRAAVRRDPPDENRATPRTRRRARS